MNTVRTAFPDFHNVIEDLIAEGNKVAALLTYTGTHQGTLFGIEPTGKRVQYSGTAIFRIKANQIVSGWVMADTLGLLQQLGIEAFMAESWADYLRQLNRMTNADYHNDRCKSLLEQPSGLASYL